MQNQNFFLFFFSSTTKFTGDHLQKHFINTSMFAWQRFSRCIFITKVEFQSHSLLRELTELC